MYWSVLSCSVVVDDVDETTAVVIFAVLIVVFAVIAIFFLVMIIRLKHKQRCVHNLFVAFDFKLHCIAITGSIVTTGMLNYQFAGLLIGVEEYGGVIAICYRRRRQRDILRINTERGLVGFKDKREPE